MNSGGANEQAEESEANELGQAVVDYNGSSYSNLTVVTVVQHVASKEEASSISKHPAECSDNWPKVKS